MRFCLPILIYLENLFCLEDSLANLRLENFHDRSNEVISGNLISHSFQSFIYFVTEISVKALIIVGEFVNFYSILTNEKENDCLIS